MAVELSRAVVLDVTIEIPEPTPAFDGKTLIDRLLGELSALEGQLVLVIDDLHEIKSADILNQLEYFAEHLPRSVHLIVISRHDPRLGLHRRRLEGSLTELRSEHLRFTLDETAQMLSAIGLSLSDAALNSLYERTEGWVAGLRLAAISMASHPDPERFVLEFSGSERTVAEYLVAEVLASLPAEGRRLLVRTSLLDRINGPLGDLLTGLGGSERYLRELADTGEFVIALDAKREWFRFHHLFADLLAVELRHTEPNEIAGLHRLAAQWYSEHGFVLDAIAHAQAAGDHDWVAGLLVEHYFSLMLDGRRATAQSLLAIAASGIDSPELAVVLAADELLDGALEQAAAQLALAERRASEVPTARRQRFDLALYVTQLSLARRIGDLQSVLDAQQPGALFVDPQTSGDIAMHNDVRALMLMNLGIVEVWSGHHDEGELHLQAAASIAEQIGRPYLKVGCDAHASQAVQWRSFTSGRQAARDAIELAEQYGWDHDQVIGPALVVMGICLAQEGRTEEADQAFLRADETLHFELEPAVAFQLHMGHGLVHHIRAAYSECIRSYMEAERLASTLVTNSPLALQATCARLAAAVAAGNLDTVRATLEGMSDDQRAAGEVREVLAVLALAEGDAESALLALAPTLEGSAAYHHDIILIRSLLLEARARDILGSRAEAEDAVERALDLAEPDELILPFMYEGCLELLEQQPAYRTAHGAFIARILDSASGRFIQDSGHMAVELLAEISEAELRVLRYLPTNLTAAGIASEMYVTVNTIKSHMRSLYFKLDVHTRHEAVSRARALGLLGHSNRRG